MCIIMRESEDAEQITPCSLDSSRLYEFVVRVFVLPSVYFSRAGSILVSETANDAEQLCIDVNTDYYLE